MRLSSMGNQPTRKRATSQDVAELAGVSMTTVSFVINNKSGGNVRISDATRQKVWDAVDALNYRPMSAARALRTKRTNLLALVVPHIDSVFQPQFAAAVQAEAELSGLDVIVYGTQDEFKRESGFVDSLISHHVDGVIIHSHQSSIEHINNLVEAGIAVVIHGNSPQLSYVDNVMIDEAGAATEMVNYLISREHRRIGLISGPEVTWGGRLRKQGYLNALQAHTIEIDPALIHEADFFKPGGAVQPMQKLLNLSNPPTALFCANDMLAMEAILSAQDAGLSVPQDLAVAGFNNTREVNFIRPRLTTVNKDVVSIAQTCLALLVERINSQGSIPARRKVLAHQLIFRESV
jgi:DNA-binding LacI/PurR family transcriptional regulator